MFDGCNGVSGGVAAADSLLVPAASVPPLTPFPSMATDLVIKAFG